jgi:ferric-dicitrate binding protein FerR (iron transport regulator)
MNTPLEEGFKLSTAEGSFAEVEFENDSTARLGQSSLLEFTQLALAPDGSKIDHLTLNAGYATFSVAPEGQDTYEIATADTTLTPRGKSLFRVDVDSSEQRVEVFNGSLDVSSALGSWSLAKDSVLGLSPRAEQPAQISEGVT